MLLSLDELRQKDVIIYQRLRTYYGETDDDEFSSYEYRKGMLSQKKDDDTEKPQFYHPYVGFNQFLARAFVEPKREDGWRKQTADSNLVVFGMCDPSKTLVTLLPSSSYFTEHKGHKRYNTLDNGGIAFVVFVNHQNNDVFVYSRTKGQVIRWRNDTVDGEFNKLLCRYTNVQTIFVGKSNSKNCLTNLSGNHGPEFDGNSLLIQLKSAYYVHIGAKVIEFATEKDDIICHYESNVGEKMIAYPYAESSEWCYDITTMERSSIDNYTDRKERGCVYNAHIDHEKKIKMVNNISGDHKGTELVVYEVQPDEFAKLAQTDCYPLEFAT